MRAHGRLRTILLLGVVAALSGLAAGPAAATAPMTWSPVTALTAPTDIPQQQITTGGNAAGDGLIAWDDTDTTGGGPFVSVVHAIRRYPDGRTGPAQVLASDGSIYPSATVAPDGTGAVVWNHFGAGVAGAILPADGSAPQPFLIDHPSDDSQPARPYAASDAAGDIVVSWQDSQSIFLSPCARATARSGRCSGSWARRTVRTPHRYTPPGWPLPPTARSPWSAGPTRPIWAAVRRPGESAFTRTVLSPSSYDTSALNYDADEGVPALATIGVGADGTVATAWKMPTDEDHSLWGAVARPGGSFWARRIAGFVEMGTPCVEAAVDGSGNATIAFAGYVPFWEAGTQADLDGLLTVTAPAGASRFGQDLPTRRRRPATSRRRRTPRAASTSPSRR